MSRSVLSICFAFVAALGALLGYVAGGGGAVRIAGSASARGAEWPPSFADIVQSVNAGVVHVTSVEGGRRRGRGDGSGFVVDSQGHILTNEHLVSGASRIRVRFADRREVPAVLVGSDANTDLALLKVDVSGLKPIPLGDSDKLRIGEWVCAIGNPFQFDHSVTVGVVSSKGRKIFDPSFDSYIQTDAAINPGNSGGPLLNAAGEAVGISAAVSREGQGIGFAVPINVAREILDQLRTSGRVSRGYLGIQLEDLDPDLQKLLGLGEAHGAVVLDVAKGGAGEVAQIQRYDVIQEVSGRPIANGDDLVRAIASKRPGSEVTLKVHRDGRDVVLSARLGARAEGGDAAAEPEALRESGRPKGDKLGLTVVEMTAAMRRKLDVPAEQRGVVVRDVAGLSSGVEALTHGDIIVEVNRRPTPDVGAYREVLGSLSAGEVAWLFVYRPGPGASFLVKLEVGGNS